MITGYQFQVSDSKDLGFVNNCSQDQFEFLSILNTVDATYLQTSRTDQDSCNKTEFAIRRCAFSAESIVSVENS